MTRGDIDRPIENWLTALAIIVVFLMAMLGCAPEEEPDVALAKHTISWPLTGGLDTKKSPLAVQPGSFLRLDNVVQERQGEWRRRNGWTQVAADTMPEVAPYFVGTLGDAGFFENGQSGVSVYSPSLASSKWSTQAVQAPPEHRSRFPLIETDSPIAGFAMAGNLIAIGSFYQSGAVFAVADKSGTVLSRTAVATSFSAFRGAATATKLVIFANNLGTLQAYVTDVATGVTAAPVTVRTGIASGSIDLDARWYGGATITVIAPLAAGGSIQFMEWNPSTGTLATDVTLASTSSARALGLLQDPDATGDRFVTASFTAPSTRIYRVTSAGSISVNDQVEAILVTQLAGVMSNSGANWNAIYRSSASPNLRVNNKTGGVVGTPAAFQASTTWGTAEIHSQAWRRTGDSRWSVIIGLNGTNTDPQTTFIEFSIPTGVLASALPASTIEPLSAGYVVGLDASMFQVVSLSANVFTYVLPVQVIYEDNAGTISKHYSLDLFTQTYLTSAADASDPTGRPVAYKQTSFVPGGQLSFYDAAGLVPLGTRYPPRAPAVTPSVGAGSLTPSSQYEYVAMVEQIDSDGNVWRSPPSVPVLVTMGVGQNTNTVVFSSWGLEPTRTYRLSLFRSAADGSSPRRWSSQLFTAGPDITVVDTFADALVNAGEVLYTEGEAPNIVTPPAYLAWLADVRLWTVNPEYPTEISYTKNLRANRLPEFTAENLVDLNDQYGGVTGGGLLDDKIVVFKKNAVYFLQGSGFTDSGSGENYVPTLISSDVGALPGSPIVSSADALYFVSERGIMRLDKQGNISWVGEPVDQYLHQPLVQTPETVYDGCFVPSANEVRFLTTNYVLVHNLTFDYWVRWTLSGFRRCLVVNGSMVMFRNDGTVWREGDQTQLTDQGTAFTGVIRSPWMRPSPGIQGSPPTNTSTTGQRAMRLYEGRIIYTRTSGGSDVALTGRIYANNDDAQVQEFTGQAIDGATLAGAASMKPLAAIQKCTSFSEELVLPSGDVTVRVDGFAAVIGLRDGAQAVDPGSRYK